MTDRASRLERLEYLGDGARFPGKIQALIPDCALFGDLSLAEAGLLAPYLDVYRCEPGTQVMGEGDASEFLLIVVEGRLANSGHEARRGPSSVDALGPGAVLGESALIDGEPVGVTCVAAEPSLLAVMHRESLARLIVGQPTLGAKLLMGLLAVFAARLRATRARLAAVLEAHPDIRENA